MGKYRIYVFYPEAPFFIKNAPNMASNNPQTHIKTILEGIAPSSLNMSPWGAMADPFMPDFIKKLSVSFL